MRIIIKINQIKMPADIPAGIFPINIRGVTCQKYGLKTGEGIHDYVKYGYVSKDEIVKEIQLLGVMSDFEPGRKAIDAYPGEKILFIIDLEEKYGEMMFFCSSIESEQLYIAHIKEKEDEELLKQQQEEQANVEPDLSYLVFEDKSVTARAWESSTTDDTVNEIGNMNYKPSCPTFSVAITRPKDSMNQSFQFTNVSVSDKSHNLKPQRSLYSNFIMKKENDNGFQVASMCQEASVQTIRSKHVNKAVQYESLSSEQKPSRISTRRRSSSLSDQDKEKEKLLNSNTQQNNKPLTTFLLKSSNLITNFLNRNKSIEIFHDTFQIKINSMSINGQNDANSSNLNGIVVQTDNELKEIKNFADPKYSKSKNIAAIEWLPKFNGYVAMSAVKNIGFDQRLITSGLAQISHVLLWDFKQLVKPCLLMQSPSEIFTLKFNKINPSILIGGSITGQVVLWDLSSSLRFLKGTVTVGGRGAGSLGASGTGQLPAAARLRESINNDAKHLEDDDDGAVNDSFLSSQMSDAGLLPKWVSALDRSHRKCVSDIFWLPPTTQINYKGELIGDEHLDGNCYQFISISADGMVMVWDTRWETIFLDELRHIARAKHIAQEKLSAKEGGLTRPLWSPIFVAHLKRIEGVGELSLSKLSFHPKLIKLPGSHDHKGDVDPRSQFMMCTEEGDVLLADLCNSRGGGGHTKTAAAAVAASGKDDDDEENTSSREYVKWSAEDHSRPAVGFQQSPFFSDILLSVSDWKFNIWKVSSLSVLKSLLILCCCR